MIAWWFVPDHIHGITSSTPMSRYNRLALAVTTHRDPPELTKLLMSVTRQCEGAPSIYDELVRTMVCFVIDMPKAIISASEQAEESVVAEYHKLHQNHDLEPRTLGIILHYSPSIKRIFQMRGTKRRSAKERRAAKRGKL